MSTQKDTPLFQEERTEAPLYMRDQWFAIYERGSSRIVVQKGKAVVLKTEHGPRKGEPLHVRHPDAFHPFGDVRRRHHGENRQTGVVVTACGKQFDARLLLVDPSSPIVHCKECQTALDAALAEHTEAEEKAAKLRAEQQRVYETSIADNITE
jgi:hypothetical protein